MRTLLEAELHCDTLYVSVNTLPYDASIEAGYGVEASLNDGLRGCADLDDVRVESVLEVVDD